MVKLDHLTIRRPRPRRGAQLVHGRLGMKLGHLALLWDEVSTREKGG